MASTIICIPTGGAPYIVGEFKTEKEFTKISKKISDEHKMSFDKYYGCLKVHPMFENIHWRQADMILTSGKAEIYADDEGGFKFMSNMGLIVHRLVEFVDGKWTSTPNGNPFGEIFLVIKDEDLNKVVKKEELQTEKQYKKSIE